jgi:hypothetical protein
MMLESELITWVKPILLGSKNLKFLDSRHGGANLFLHMVPFEFWFILTHDYCSFVLLCQKARIDPFLVGLHTSPTYRKRCFVPV